MTRAKAFLLLAAAIAAAAAVAQAGLLGGGTAPKVTGGGATAVKAGTVRLVAMTPKLALTGTIEGETSVVVSAKIAGRIAAVPAEDGLAATVGQPLVRLESVELANAVRMSRDGVARAGANHENATTDYQRYLTLFRQGAVSRQTLDSAEMRLKVAAADLSTARAGLSTAEEQYAYATVTAPADGVVANKTAAVGQVVAAGQALMTVEDIRRVYAVVNVAQKDAGPLRPGLAATVAVDTYPGQQFAGRAAVVNPAAGAANRTFRVKVLVDNADGSLKPGMFVRAQIATGAETQVVAAPLEAVFQRQGLYYVFVPEDGRAVRRQVEAGQVLEDMIEIRSGLTAGTPVLTSNLGSLKDGDPVRVMP